MENIKTYEEHSHDPKEITHGLIAVDPTQEGEMLDILHFAGYWTEPSKEDAESLREELMNDEEFGLTDIAHRLDILPATKDIVEEYRRIINESGDE